VQYRANATYRDVDIDGTGCNADRGRLETKLQSASVRLSQPPNEHGWIGTYSAGALRTDIEGLVTRTASAGTRWHTIEERDEQALSGTFFLDEQEPSGAPFETSHALYGEYERYWRRVDNLLAPSSGWMATRRAVARRGRVDARLRLLGRFAAGAPRPRDRAAARAQAGAVLASTRNGIPSALLFLTGGDTTVRGYAFESLGVQEGDATVPGRYYAVLNAGRSAGSGSVGTRGVRRCRQCDRPRSRTFIALGYGTGVRVRTPLGPFRLDVAYGQDVRKVRLHFSVG
jgi:translocation and assembly module TamA